MRAQWFSHEIGGFELSTLTFAGWNQVVLWLRTLDTFRSPA
jgi:hypothetical protein